MSAATWNTYHPNSAHAMIKGVCARIADRAGVPVWIPRLAFLIFGLAHWLIAVIAYFVMSKFFCAGRATPHAPTQVQPQNPVHERFAALDRRLADMEAATLNQEADLRRAFRDLEQH
jgi:phage shock protein PspC (stress-responsive transcriptional regulator)